METTRVRAGVAGRRDRRVLDLLFAAAFVVGLAQLGLRAERVSGALIGAGLIAFAGILASWLLLRGSRTQSPHRLPALTLMMLTATLPFLLNGSAAWPMFLFGLLVFVPRWGAGFGAVLIAAVALAQFVILIRGSLGPGEAAVESLSSVIIFGAGLATAWLVSDHDRQRREIGDLLAERERHHVGETELLLAQERNRAARALHDGLGHRLTLIAMSLHYASEARDRHPATAWEQIDQAQVQAGEALQEMRRWVRAMTPLPEGDEASPESFERLADNFRGTGLDISVDVTGSEDMIDIELRDYLRHFVQEGLTNILRHATGQIVTVELIIAESIRISVRDAGDTGDGSDSRSGVVEGFGLRSLRERAEQLDGRFVSEPTVDGFMIIAELPLHSPPVLR